MAFNAKNIIIGAAPLNITTKDSTDSAYAVVEPAAAQLNGGAAGSMTKANGDINEAVWSAGAAAYTNVDLQTMVFKLLTTQHTVQ